MVRVIERDLAAAGGKNRMPMGHIGSLAGVIGLRGLRGLRGAGSREQHACR